MIDMRKGKLCLVAISIASVGIVASSLAVSADDAPAAGGQPPQQVAPEALEHFNAAVNAHAKNQLDVSVNEYKLAIAADSKMNQAWDGLGAIYVAQRKYDMAVQAYQNALAIKPNRPSTLNGLGMALSKAGRTQEAATKFREAITYDPNLRSAYYNLAAIYQAGGKPEDAKKIIDSIPKSAVYQHKK